MAPLIPLEPEFPLDLTEANRFILIENPALLEEEKKQLKQALKQHAFPWLAIIILLGGGATCWIAYLTHELWPKPKEKPVISLTPMQQAYECLQKLKNENLVEKKLFQVAYTRLSSILFNFLKTSFGMQAKEITAVELTIALKNESRLSEGQKQVILSFFSELDQVKYAGKTPTLEEAMQMQQKIQNFIQMLGNEMP